MSTGRDQPATPAAHPVDLAGAWNASDADVGDRLHPLYGPSLARLPDGPAVFRGLPFALGSRDAGRRWILLERELAIDLAPRRRASHLVIAHFADSWRDASGDRPPGMPVGWVFPTGEPLARYRIELADGRTIELDVRRRFEVADGIIGWGFLPFAAIGHRIDETLDWRGPYPRQVEGRYAPAGHGGALTVLPGSWGASQTGVADAVPSPEDDVTYWLHAIALPPDAVPVRLHLTPLGGGRPGTSVVVAGLTLFDGTADPLVLSGRRQVLVEGTGGAAPEVDLGMVIQSRPAALAPAGRTSHGGPIGWGHREPGATDPAEAADGSPVVVDIAMAPDATLSFGGWRVAAADLVAPLRDPGGTISIQPLAPADVRVEVRITADGEVAPARVRFVAADGRYLPPLGHREEVNPATFEDTGAGLILGGDTYAYVPGTFSIDLPPGAVEVEVVKGFDHRPIRMEIVVDETTRELELELERAIDLRAAGWVSADPHVHFLAPSTALLQAAAEDVTLVHLLATQLGDEFTNVTDLWSGDLAAPDGRHMVLLGTENRQNMLGHLALLGARRPVLPMASGGAPEGRVGAAVVELLADWADRCHADGGLVVGAHFPLPLAEIAADIVAGRIDAIEMQTFAPGLDNPTVTRVVPLPELRLPAAGPRRHRQDVGRDGRRRGPDVRATRPWPAAVVRGLGRRGAGRADAGVLGPGPRARGRRPRTGRRRAPPPDGRSARDPGQGPRVAADHRRRGARHERPCRRGRDGACPDRSAGPDDHDRCRRRRLDRGASPEPVRDRLGLPDEHGRPHLARVRRGARSSGLRCPTTRRPSVRSSTGPRAGSGRWPRSRTRPRAGAWSSASKRARPCSADGPPAPHPEVR